MKTGGGEKVYNTVGLQINDHAGQAYVIVDL